MSAQPQEAVGERDPLSLGTAAARTLATVVKTPPQMREITPRHLLRVLPWIEVTGGAYRVNRRLTRAVGDGRVAFVNEGRRVRVIPEELRELPVLRGFDGDPGALGALAERFVQHDLEPGEAVPAGEIVLIAYGKAAVFAPGAYGARVQLGVAAAGDRLRAAGEALTRCVVLTLAAADLAETAVAWPDLRAHLDRGESAPPGNRHGEAAIEVVSGHSGEPRLPGTFVDYDLAPREYELSVAQTILRVHTRVADLYNEPLNQTREQLRLTVEALRERQEEELVNNREFGLLHNADLKQRIHTRTGPPTPDDLDDLLSRRRSSHYFLAHPLAIAAFSRQCNRLRVRPGTTEIPGVLSWRGVPMLPCDKIPVTGRRMTSIIVIRTGKEKQGVVGLRATGLPDEYEPGLSVRFMGVNDQAVINYLVTAYYSVAPLVPDALGVLEDVEV